MAVRSVPDLRAARWRWVADRELSHLFAEVESARAADRVSRGSRHPSAPLRGDAALASSLGAYATALLKYRLPVPPVIRDELRLQRSLPS
ncbi:hypothetical protein [Kribbella shirazensis]|uniref:Uncharacterized protein n=1 Tax=Kribbella shirazensis TaxID=1105143 RepID=A0A7X5VIA2_9ACTN|nr:hypothetical protein [Kribbella shirazensis]NIK61574.1 hypothetical protein [Kribbella shirazensis]